MAIATRLILVEGSIGAGKTTATRALAELLRIGLAGSGVDVRSVLEGDPEHPADLERVAVLDDEALAALRSTYPAHAAALRAVTRPSTVPGVDLVPYGVLERDLRGLPDPMRQALAERDAYELPLPEHAVHRMAQWRQFAAEAAASPRAWVLDCVALQNPLTLSLIRDDAPLETSVGLVTDLLDAVAHLSPIVVHLRPADVGAAFRRAMAERPEWWLDHVVAYYTRGRLGRRLGARGVDGAIRVLRHRAEVEQRLLDALEDRGVHVIRIDVDGVGGVERSVTAIADAVADGWRGPSR